MARAPGSRRLLLPLLVTPTRTPTSPERRRRRCRRRRRLGSRYCCRERHSRSPRRSRSASRKLTLAVVVAPAEAKVSDLGAEILCRSSPRPHPKVALLCGLLLPPASAFRRPLRAAARRAGSALRSADSKDFEADAERAAFLASLERAMGNQVDEGAGGLAAGAEAAAQGPLTPPASLEEAVACVARGMGAAVANGERLLQVRAVAAEMHDANDLARFVSYILADVKLPLDADAAPTRVAFLVPPALATQEDLVAVLEAAPGPGGAACGAPIVEAYVEGGDELAVLRRVAQALRKDGGDDATPRVLFVALAPPSEAFVGELLRLAETQYEGSLLISVGPDVEVKQGGQPVPRGQREVCTVMDMHTYQLKPKGGDGAEDIGEKSAGPRAMVFREYPGPWRLLCDADGEGFAEAFAAQTRPDPATIVQIVREFLSDNARKP